MSLLVGISGRISYEGSQTGVVYVLVQSDPPLFSEGLLLYCPLDETNGQVLDQSGFGHSGTNHGAVPARIGVFGQCYWFDGTNDYIDFGSAEDLNLTNHFSIFAWVRLDEDTDEEGTVVGRDVNSARQYSLGTRGHPYGYGTTPYYEFQGAGGATVLFRGPGDFTQSLTLGEWHHLGITFDGTNYQAYLDGQVLATKSAEALPDAADTHLYLGGRQYVGSFNGHRGYIDEVRIYDRALSPAEVQTLYSMTSSVARVVDVRSIGSYAVTKLPNRISYWVSAYMDCDGDGAWDTWEPWGVFQANPVGLVDFASGIDLVLKDSDIDGDGLPDWWEVQYFGRTTPLPEEDEDEDGLTNLQEYEHTTDPSMADTDGDGLSDGVEVDTYGTQPTRYDTDGDGFSDGEEVAYGLDPTNSAECFADPDDDGFPTGYEVRHGTDKDDPSSYPTATLYVDPQAPEGGGRLPIPSIT